MKPTLVSYLDVFLGIFAFIMIGQIIIQEVPVPEIPAVKWERERGQDQSMTHP